MVGGAGAAVDTTEGLLRAELRLLYAILLWVIGRLGVQGHAMNILMLVPAGARNV